MHRVRSDQRLDLLGPYPQRCDRQRDAALGEAVGGVLGRHQAVKPPRRILQRRLHTVPAIEDHRPVAVARRGSPRLLLERPLPIAIARPVAAPRPIVRAARVLGVVIAAVLGWLRESLLGSLLGSLFLRFLAAEIRPAL